MEALAENWFFVLVLLACVGMHVFGHGHTPSDRRHGEREGMEPR